MSDGAVPPRKQSRAASLSQVAMIGGFGSVGLSSFALLAAGPRILGPDGYSALALTWTVVTIVGIGITSPGEQTITRGLASGGQAGIVIVVARRLLLVPIACAVGLPIALAFTEERLENEALWVTTVTCAALSWVLLSCVRGLLAGHGRFSAYAVTLAIEAVARIVLVGAAFTPVNGKNLLALSVFLPLALAAAVGWAFFQWQPVTFDAPIAEDSRLEQLSITGVAVMGQICLSTAPLWLSWQSTDAAIAGAFVSATSYMRIPLLLAGGLYGPILADAARQYAAGDRAAVLNRTVAGLGAGVGGSSAVVLLLLLVAGPALTLLYGGSTGLSSWVLVWMGLTTIGSVASNILTQLLYGCQRSPSAAVAWVPAAAITSILFAVADGDVALISAYGAFGQLIAVVALFALLPRALPSLQVRSLKSE